MLQSEDLGCFRANKFKTICPCSDMKKHVHVVPDALKKRRFEIVI